MKSRMKCLSISRKNEDTWDLVQEYADMWGMSDSGAVFYIVREYGRLHLKDKMRAMEAIR